MATLFYRLKKSLDFNVLLWLLLITLISTSCGKKMHIDEPPSFELITQAQARNLIKNFKGPILNNMHVKGFSVSDDIIKVLSRRSFWHFGIYGFQNYYGMDESRKHMFIICVPLDEKGNETKVEEGDDKEFIVKIPLNEKEGRPCPYACDLSSAVTPNPPDPTE